MKTPLLLINFKSYQEALAEKGLQLAKLCEKVSSKYDVNIAVCPQYVDIPLITSEVDIPVFAQHIDDVYPGARTGYVTAPSIRKARACGTLINHSERKLELNRIKRTIDLAKHYKLITVCCSGSFEESRYIIQLKPDFLAYEPPELIGTGMSVSENKPEVISKTIELIRTTCPETKSLVGAGVSNGHHIRTSLKYGADGVLLSSAVVKAFDRESVLNDLASAMKDI